MSKEEEVYEKWEPKDKKDKRKIRRLSRYGLSIGGETKTVIKEIPEPVKHDFHKNEIKENYKKLYDLIDEHYRKNIGREKKLYEEMQTVKEDSSLNSFVENKMQAMLFGRMMECRDNELFLENLAELTIKYILPETKDKILQYEMGKDAEEGKAKLAKDLFGYFGEEITDIIKHVRKNQTLEAYLITLYCLRKGIREREIECRELFRVYCVGREEPPFLSWESIRSTVRSKWKSRRSERTNIRRDLIKKYGEKYSDNDLSQFYSDEIELNVDTTFPTFKDFLYIFSPRNNSF